jgi:hypothetical protein
LPVVPDESACPAAPAPASAGGVEEFAQLVKVRSPFHNPVFFLIVVLACMTNVALLFSLSLSLSLFYRNRRTRNS